MSDEPAKPEEVEAEIEAVDEAIVEAEVEAVEEAIEEAVVEAEIEAVEEAIVEAEVEAVEEAIEEAVVEAEKSEKAPKSKKKDSKKAAEAAIPGADLVPDIVAEGEQALPTEGDVDAFEVEGDSEETAEEEVAEVEVVVAASIDLAKDARYHATGKRKTSVARVTLKPGKGEYTINGRALDEMFPRLKLTKTIRQPLEVVGYESKMDVDVLLHGGGVSSGAEAVRHGIARALVKADPALRGELKRRGFLTRDPRVVERKKAGLKKARKRPQFSKR